MEKYICGIISNCKCKPLAIYCNPDHTHVLIGLHSTISVSELVTKIKSNSSRFYHQNLETNHFFAWQDGYGVFSYSHSQIDKVYHYIRALPYNKAPFGKFIFFSYICSLKV